MYLIFCDNDKQQAEDFKQRFSDVLCDDKLDYCTSPDFIIEAINTGNIPDAVFLDVELDSCNGLDFSEKLYDIAPKVRIIVITAYAEKFVQDAFLKKENITAFLSKPISEQYLTAALLKVRSQLATETLVLRHKSGMDVIETEHVIYLESKGHLVIVHSENGECYSVTAKLSEICDHLPEDFVCCHKSFAVNIRKIRRFETRTLCMSDGTEIPVSRARLNETREKFNSYLGS